MTIEEILNNSDKKEVIEQLCRETVEGRNREEYIAEYKGDRSRRSTSVGNRETKEIDIYSETETDEDGNPQKIGTKTVFPSKVSTNAPKRIVRTAAAFLFGGDMSVSFSEENEASRYFKELVIDKLKLKSVLNKFARTVMTETKSAILFYPAVTVVDGKENIEIRIKILSHQNGEFYPHFDEYDNMDAFVRKYKAPWRKEGKEYEMVWIQTAYWEYNYVNVDGSWQEEPKKPNLAKKITVVYTEQDKPEWEDVVTVMDAYENRLSRLIDTNDYFSEPILKTYGATALPSKSTVGKQIEFEVTVDQDTGKMMHGDADYLVWQQSVDSIKLELSSLREEVFSGSSTPDLSFENMRGIGALSGTAIELMFMDAFIKSAEKMELFGPVVIRCISVITAMLSNITEVRFKEQLKKARPKITFGTILPDNLSELVDMLTKANGDKPLNSRKTITSRSPFTNNVEEEMKQMQKEADEDLERLVGLTIPNSTE